MPVGQRHAPLRSALICGVALTMLALTAGVAQAATTPTPTPTATTSLPATPGATSSAPDRSSDLVTSDGSDGGLVVRVARYIPYPASATALGGNGIATATMPIPPGLTPVVINGTLTSVADTPGVVRIRVGSAYVTMDAALGGTFSIPITPDAVVDDTVTIEVRNTLEPGVGDCEGDFTTTETIDDLVLGFIGRETPPVTIAGFFSPPVQHITLVTPEGTTSDNAAATLAAAGALAMRYDRTVPIDVRDPADFDADPASKDDTDGPNRVVRLEVTDADKVSVTVDNPGIPTITLSGPSDKLVNAAAALASTGLGLAAVADATELSEERRAAAVRTLSLADLGQPRPTLSGIGRLVYTLAVTQDAFGGPINAVTIHFEGTHTPIAPGGAATASVLWNDQLIEAQQLADNDTYSADVTIDGDLIRRSNTLSLSLDVTPPGGECGVAVQPMRMDLNGFKSTVSATPGQSLVPGFQRFPQGFGTVMHVAFGSGPLTPEIVNSACALVISLQRASTEQLSITTEDFASFLAQPYPGMVVGATPADANALKAPLRYELWRQVNTEWTDFAVTVDGPFAALEAFDLNGRNILMLGGTNPVNLSQPLSTKLADEAQNGEFGWFGLRDNILVAQPTGPLVYLSDQTLVPQDSVKNEGRKLPPWWLFLVVAVLLLLLVRWWMLRRRKKRIDKRVAAAEAEAIDTTEPDDSFIDDEGDGSANGERPTDE